MEFRYTIIYVPDVLKTISFYENAFGLQRGFVDPQSQYGELKTGQTTLSFASEKLRDTHGLKLYENRIKQDAAGIEIVFCCDNVQEAWETAVKKGCTALSPPKLQPWGQTLAYVRDCNGVLVEIASKISE